MIRVAWMLVIKTAVNFLCDAAERDRAAWERGRQELEKHHLDPKYLPEIVKALKRAEREAEAERERLEAERRTASEPSFWKVLLFGVALTLVLIWLGKEL